MAGVKRVASRRKKTVGPLPPIKRIGPAFKPKPTSGKPLPKRGPGDHPVGGQKIRKT